MKSFLKAERKLFQSTPQNVFLGFAQFYFSILIPMYGRWMEGSITDFVTDYRGHNCCSRLAPYAVRAILFKENHTYDER